MSLQLTLSINPRVFKEFSEVNGVLKIAVLKNNCSLYLGPESVLKIFEKIFVKEFSFRNNS